MKGMLKKGIIWILMAVWLSSCSVSVEQEIKKQIEEYLGNDDYTMLSSQRIKNMRYELVMSKKKRYLFTYSIMSDVYCEGIYEIEKDQLYVIDYQTDQQNYIIICADNSGKTMAGFEFTLMYEDTSTMKVSDEVANKDEFIYIYPCEFSFSLSGIIAYDASGEPVTQAQPLRNVLLGGE